MPVQGFTGFPPETLSYLEELAANNDREWFTANKGRYDQVVLEPALRFIAAMGPLLDSISHHILAVPTRTRGSLMRVHRDTRFAKDKTPYKTNIGIQFRHERAKDVHAPGFYVHIEVQEAFVALGTWHPAPDALAKIRDRIVAFPGEWEAARDDQGFRAAFELSGDRLTRPPKGYDPDHPCSEDLKWKDFLAVQTVGAAEIGDPDFPIYCAKQFATSRGYMSFLCAALGVPF
ncbi:MAG: TIGR02453 family protein [Deferrisomatales bacterium]|nr:TIGR02453 family protein [Deferrisomatales bacterium]